MKRSAHLNPILADFLIWACCGSKIHLCLFFIIIRPMSSMYPYTLMKGTDQTKPTRLRYTRHLTQVSFHKIYVHDFLGSQAQKQIYLQVEQRPSPPFNTSSNSMGMPNEHGTM